MDTKYTYRKIRLRVKKEVKKSSRGAEDWSYEDADNFRLFEHLLTGKVSCLIVPIRIAHAKALLLRGQLPFNCYICFKFYFKIINFFKTLFCRLQSHQVLHFFHRTCITVLSK